MDKLTAEKKRLEARCEWLCEEINCLDAEIHECMDCADDADEHAFGPDMAEVHRELAMRKRELDESKEHVHEVEKKLRSAKKPKAGAEK